MAFEQENDSTNFEIPQEKLKRKGWGEAVNADEALLFADEAFSLALKCFNPSTGKFLFKEDSTSDERAMLIDDALYFADAARRYVDDAEKLKRGALPDQYHELNHKTLWFLDKCNEAKVYMDTHDTTKETNEDFNEESREEQEEHREAA